MLADIGRTLLGLNYKKICFGMPVVFSFIFVFILSYYFYFDFLPDYAVYVLIHL